MSTIVSSSSGRREEESSQALLHVRTMGFAAEREQRRDSLLSQPGRSHDLPGKSQDSAKRKL